MTTIIYKLVDGFGECRAIDGCCSDKVKFIIKGADGGLFSIGNKHMRFFGETVRIDLKTLSDGEYSPTLSADGKIYPLERLKKRGDSITRSPLDIELLSRMLLRLEASEARLSKMEGALAELVPLIKGNPIF